MRLKGAAQSACVQDLMGQVGSVTTPLHTTGLMTRSLSGVFFMRHAESEANKTQTDLPDPLLTARGQEQAGAPLLTWPHSCCVQAAEWASTTSSWDLQVLLISP